MKMKNLVGERFKEKPSDCVIGSHALMLRGGYMKHVANGIFSLNTPLRRVVRKIEAIIREEMDLIDGQEVLFPVVMPASLWEASGRFASVGKELLRVKDRNGSQMLLGMTHEEAAVHLVQEYGNSYLKYPFMVYQIQTKFRDEARPRGGLIRVREFTMKDAYSFHTSQEDLERYYLRCFHAYERIFARVGLSNVVSVASDSGMMGGSVSHEFMLMTPVGEDSIAVCGCGYRANVEAAESKVENEKVAVLEPLRLTATPETNTIEAVCRFLNAPIENSCKAVVFQKNATDEYVIVFIRGDLDISETKLANILGGDIRPAKITENSGICAGFIGPHELNGSFAVLFDCSLEGACNLVCGANKRDYHYTGLNIARDCGEVEYYDIAKIKDGGLCPNCGRPVSVSRGIEVGNIFQLGTKYTKAMGMKYQDKDESLRNPIMGCYGIGIGRLAASVCEEHHDEHGPIWPMPIAPWQVQICCLRAEDADVKAVADLLYENLGKCGIEVLYDDRNVSAGVMFSDADLMGVPLRIIVSPRNLKANCCEIISRDKLINKKILKEDAVEEVRVLINNQMGFCER